MKTLKTTLIAAGLGLLALPAHAGDAAAPQKAAVCFACHGPAGAKPILPQYPVLAGQYPNYIAHALHEYKSGARTNPVMGAQAATLSDEDISALAQYFGQQQSPLYTPMIPGHAVKAAAPAAPAPAAAQ